MAASVNVLLRRSDIPFSWGLYGMVVVCGVPCVAMNASIRLALNPEALSQWNCLRGGRAGSGLGVRF